MREWLHAWRHFFGALGLVLVVVLFYAEENWRGPWAWGRYKRQLEARGERLDGSAFVPPPAVAEDNFAATPSLAWLRGMGQLAARYDEAARTIKGKTQVRSSSFVLAPIDLAVWQEAFLNSTNHLGLATNATPQGAAAIILAALAEADPMFEELQGACGRSRSRFNLSYDQEDPASILLPHLSVLKRLSQVLQLRACAELALGRTAEAASDIDLMFCLADAGREEPILISHLVRFAQLELALQPLAEGMGQWSEPQLRRFQDRLGRFDFLADARRTLAAERALFVVGEIEYVRRAPERLRGISALSTRPNRGGGMELTGLLLSETPAGWLDLEQLTASRLFQDYLLPTIDVTQHRIRADAVRRADARIATLVGRSPPGLLLHHEFFAAVMTPALSGAVRKAAFAQTAAELAAVACALERYRLAKGDWPESLASLTPQFVQKLPHDVINGQPLKYRRTEDGRCLLYSVGWNERDDGGTAGLNEKGTGIAMERGDWVWRGGVEALKR